MNTIKLLKNLEYLPLFTTNDLAKITGKKPEYIRIIIHRLIKKGHIKKIERGKYTVHDDPLILASHLSVPSYLSLWTSLRFYNWIEQLPKEISVMVPKPRKDVNFLNTKITFTTTKYFFGYVKSNYNGFDIFMADMEKTILDCLISKKIPLDIIEKTIKEGKLDIKKLKNYAEKTKNISLIKRLCFLMETYSFSCRNLEKQIDKNYILLDASKEKKGEKNKRWRIIDNR